MGRRIIKIAHRIALPLHVYYDRPATARDSKISAQDLYGNPSMRRDQLVVFHLMDG